MIYEVINPSDPYTIVADDHAVATVACLLLGDGRYGLKPLGDGKRVPIFFAGGADEWCRETFGADLPGLVGAVIAQKRTALADCLDSCIIGDRGDFDLACSKIDGAAGIAEFKIARHERQRSSMNDIGGRAYALAAKLRAMPAPEAA